MPFRLVMICMMLFTFFFEDAFCSPIIKSISPSIGSSKEETLVAIKGKGFIDATTVLFGDSPACFSIKSDTLIMATTPRHAPQVVPVTVTGPCQNCDSSESSSEQILHFFTFI